MDWQSAKVKNALLAVTAPLLLGSLYLALVWAPNELTMGQVYRIMYIHVPVSWVAFLAFFVVFVASLVHLWKRDLRSDVVAQSAAELGVLFTTLSLVTGAIWGKPTWGVWWTWDPRLTSTLLLWMIYVGYLMVRTYAAEGQASRFAAVVGIIGFVDVPIVYFSIWWWQNIHPEAVVRGTDINMSWEMSLTLFLSVLAFTLLYVYLQLQRVRLQWQVREVEIMKRAYLTGESLAELEILSARPREVQR
ncbi:MAG: cytochrome c biogenesis protein CcsA [Chloroflexi bacterium]|nr:cytochrome c biogenesis protein CcsA [Chloroflexota bacterium]